VREIAVFGHRGARGLAPENTLAGFALARSMGLTGCEFDIGLSADGVAMVHHDPRLNPDLARGPDGAYVASPAALLRDLTAAQLGTYDVGRLRASSDYAARYPAQHALDGARIPTLDAAMDTIGDLDLLIEVKTFPDRPDETAAPAVMAEAAISALRSIDAIDRVVLVAFDWRVLREAAAIEPALRRGCLTTPERVSAGSIWLDGAELVEFGDRLPQAVAATGASVWAPLHTLLEEGELREAQALGLTVIPWTVNTGSDIERLIGLGVDGLVSDRPDLALETLRRCGRTPALPGFVAHLHRGG